MANSITRRQGDTAQVLTAALTINGAAADLTNASGVKIHVVNSSGTDVVNTAATIVSPPTGGNISYAWQTADVATAGNFTIEFIVTYSDGTTLTFPNGTSNPTLTLTPQI